MVEHIIFDGVHQFLNGMGAECCYGQGNKGTVPSGMIQFIISGSMGSFFYAFTVSVYAPWGATDLHQTCR